MLIRFFGLTRTLTKLETNMEKETDTQEGKSQEANTVPQLTMQDGKVVLPTFEVPLLFNGQEEMIVLQKVNTGTRIDISKKYLQTKFVGNQVQGNVDAMGYQIAILSKAIIKAPFEVSEAILKQFPENVTDYLYKNYENAFGDLSKKKD